MIDNFSGVDTEFFCRGVGERYCFCRRRHAVMNVSFFKGQVKSPILITQGIGQSSMFLTFQTICNLGKGLGLWVGWWVG